MTRQPQSGSLQVIGHRGAAGLAPENTWASFDAAIAHDVHAIETDVRATRDKQLILIHDSRLDRTTTGHGRVRDMPWSAIRDLDAGSWFNERFASARIPLLRPTLERYAGTIPFVLEIKQRGIESALLNLVVDMGLINNVTFTSFHFEALRQIQRRSASASIGFLSTDSTNAAAERAAAAGFCQFCPPADGITAEQVKNWKQYGLAIRVWGVKNRAMAQAATAAGVDGLTVKNPPWIMGAADQ